jgi:tetratricopeptide (TPR) repeat protein
MKTTVNDAKRAASVAASEGEVALADGDTIRAKEQFELAGDLLRDCAEDAVEAGERNHRRFLAASQYYHAGEYRKASDLCRRIETTLLDEHSKKLCQQLCKESRLRARPDYEQGVRSRIAKVRMEERFTEVLQILRDHPYVLPRDMMAYIRADCCEALKDYRTAALFISDAVQFGLAHINPFYFAAGATTALIQTDLDAAWEFASHLLELLPHPLTSLSASLVCYNQAGGADAEPSHPSLDRQLDLFEMAERELSAASCGTIGGAETQSWMQLPYEAAALTYTRKGKFDIARRVAEAAVSFDPGNEFAKKVRDLVHSAGANAASNAELVVKDQLIRHAKSARHQRDALLLPA